MVHTVEGLLSLLALDVLFGFLGGIDNATDHDDLVAWVVFQSEGESAIGPDASLLTILVLALFVLVLVLLILLVLVTTIAALALAALTLTLAENLVEGFLTLHLLVVVLLFLVVFLVIFILILFLILFGVLLALGSLLAGGADSLFVNPDGGLMDELVDVQLMLALLVTFLLVLLLLIALSVLLSATTALLLLFLLLLSIDSAQVSLIGVEHILNALFAQGLLGIQFVLDLELGQLQVDLLLLLFGLFQQLFQLLTILDLGLLNLVQTVLVLGHDHEQGHFLLLSGHTDDLQLLIFVIVELALSLHDLDAFGLLASQWVEWCLSGLLLLTELASPKSLDLSSVDNNHLGVLGDGVLWHDLSQFLVGLLGHITVDLLTALLWLALEVALFDLGVQAGLHGLDELLLSAVALVDHDGGGGLDLRLLLLSILALDVALSLEALLESSVGMTALLLAQSSASDALQLAPCSATSTTLNGGQSQLEGSWGDNGVLVVVLLFGLLVQPGSQ